MVTEESKDSPQDQKQSNPVESGQNAESLFSPGFKSVAAMAGWDEESIMIASLIVEDTPERDFKSKKRIVHQFKTPPSTNSRRKRRDRRKSITSNPVPLFNLDEEEPEKQQGEKEQKKTQPKVDLVEEKKADGDELTKQDSGVSFSNSVLPCMDKLREELSCAICLEICFEPSTTSCGHSFCKKCLRSAADKCGKKCPKCRQLISNGRSCTVNTVLWNTIQLLFPQEVEARKASGELHTREAERKSPELRINTDTRNRHIRVSRLASRDASVTSSRGIANRGTSERTGRTSGRDGNSEIAQRLEREDFSWLLRESSSRRRRGATLNQDEDAALAFRLQREEFMDAFREGGTRSHDQTGSSLSIARANLRAMASRAVSSNIRTRGVASRAVSSNIRTRGGNYQ